MKDIYEQRKQLHKLVKDYPLQSSLLTIVQTKANIDILQADLLGSSDTDKEVRYFFSSFCSPFCLDIAMSGYNWYRYRPTPKGH